MNILSINQLIVLAQVVFFRGNPDPIFILNTKWSNTTQLHEQQQVVSYFF